MKSLSDAGALLAKATKELRMSWDQTASVWRDQARAGFQAAHLDELEHRAKAATGAMDQISALLREAIAKCR